MKGVTMTDLVKYGLNSSVIGTIAGSMPYPDLNSRLEIYRLMRFTLKYELEKCGAKEDLGRLFREAGKLAGMNFYFQVLGSSSDFQSFIKNLQYSLKYMGIGIVWSGKSDRKSAQLILSASEDAHCSGFPGIDYEMCNYDEGFFAGLLEGFSGMPFSVEKISCWSMCDQTCQFKAEAIRGRWREKQN
jgi:uncharacterized protein